MECYSAVKRNGLRPFVEKWMKLVCHTEWSKSEIKKINIVYRCMCVGSRKMIQINLFAGKE